MNMEILRSFTEKLRIEIIGKLGWIPEKEIFEYKEGDVKTVAMLKAVRAAQGIQAMNLLCNNGLFIYAISNRVSFNASKSLSYSAPCPKIR